MCFCMNAPDCLDLTGTQKGFPLVWKESPDDYEYNRPEAIKSLNLKNDPKIAVIDFLIGFSSALILLIASNTAGRRISKRQVR